MSLKKTSSSHHSSLTELNITPLLDLVFVLLVIFIITTPQMMNNLEMNLPSPKPPPPQNEKPKVNNIVVDEKGQTFLNNQPVTVAQLTEDLKRLQSENPDLSVVVKGADNVDYQNMINVLDVLQRLDITKVGLATEDSAAPGFLTSQFPARLQRMAGQKFRRVHSSSTLRLQFQNPQRIFAAGDDNAIFVRRQNVSRVGTPRCGVRTAQRAVPTGIFLDNFRLPDFQ